MAIYPALINESIVQASDLTRLDASRTSVTPGEVEISKLEIQPETDTDPMADPDAAVWFDVTNQKYLDWEYATDGEKTVTVRVATDGDPVEITRTLLVITEADDNLLSSDEELRTFEHSVQDYLPAGRNTFKNIHRQCQKLIIDHINENGTRDSANALITPAAIVHTQQFRKWATFLALQIIFEGLSNEVDDVFHKKSENYGSLAFKASQLAIISLDLNGDGKDDADNESVSFGSIRAVRS